VTLGEIHIRLLRPDVAMACVRWTLAGVVDREGKLVRERRGLATLGLTKENGVWKIATYVLAEINQ